MKITISEIILLLLSINSSAFQTDYTANLQSIVTPEKEISFQGQTIELPEIARTGSDAFFKSEGNSLPIIMIPCLGLSKWIFTETPDGHDSWAQSFSEQGHDVYIYNDPSIFVNPNLAYDQFLDGTSK